MIEIEIIKLIDNNKYFPVFDVVVIVKSKRVPLKARLDIINNVEWNYLREKDKKFEYEIDKHAHLLRISLMEKVGRDTTSYLRKTARNYSSLNEKLKL